MLFFEYTAKRIYSVSKQKIFLKKRPDYNSENTQNSLS